MIPKLINNFLKLKANILLSTILMVVAVNNINAQFVHPGLSHKLSDLERMKAMIDAGIEPWSSSFEDLSNQPRAQYDIVISVVNQDPSYVIEYSGASDNWLINDSTTAYFNALMWYFTGDSRHAEKAIEVFKVWSGLRRSTTRFALTNGRIVRLIEAAEIIKHTYSGWSTSDREAFEDMLVYPGYSNTTVPTTAIANDDVTFYWRIYNGDPQRIGNQGLIAMRLMMSMGIFLDNEIMYDRAVRYMQGYPHRLDDLAYPSGPPIQGAQTLECEYGNTWSSGGLGTSIPDYGYNEVIGNYIYENGQCQEASRDQAHSMGGVSGINVMSEIAWNQGDDLYGHLNNRPLLGMEYTTRYNLSYDVAYPDQLNPWEPTIANGEYLFKVTRHLRRELVKINPGIDCNEGSWTRGNHNLAPVYELPLAHYRDRLKTLPSEDYKWIQRGQEYVLQQNGYEGIDLNGIQIAMYGSLFNRRVSPGDPISGFDSDGLPVYKMNDLSMTIEAENYDYFVLDGQDRTYNDTSSSNEGGVYRTDEGVDLKTCSEGGSCLTKIENGEWITYTVNVPANGTYDIEIRYAAGNANGKLKFNFGGSDVSSEVSVPFGGPNSTGLTDWKDFEVVKKVHLTQGVQAMKILFSGADSAFELNNITVNLVETDLDPVNLAVLYGVATQSTDRSNGTGLAPLAIDGNTDGVFGNASVSHTTGNTTSDPGPWWQVDLGENYNIETINVFNRTDCCGDRLDDFTVEVLNSNGTPVFTQFYDTFPNSASYLEVVTGGVVGRVVRISKTTSTALALAEVEVHGVDVIALSNKKIDGGTKLELYPNPVIDSFTIHDSAGSNMVIFDILGKEVFSESIQNNKQSFDISPLNAGVFFIKVYKEAKVTTKTIIKK